MRESRTFGERSRTKVSDEVNKKCFFIFEGNKTEPIYFASLKDLRSSIGISSLIDFIQIEKSRGEDWSNPKKLLERLHLELSEGITYNILINAIVDTLYTDEYLNKHEDRIKEFSDLLNTFIHNELQKNDSDLVDDIDSTINKTVNFFIKERQNICKIILNNIESSLENYNITYDKTIDYMCLVVDRDPDSFTEKQFDEVLDVCNQNGYRFLISNPNFEFWLLLHFDVVNSLDKEQMLKNEKINSGSKSSVRFLYNELRRILGNYKKDKYDSASLVKKIDIAIKNEKSFCETLPELKTKLGSNIGLFIEELRTQIR